MNKRTKRLGIGGVVAGGLMLGAAGLVIAAGIAKGDSYDFVADVRIEGFQNASGNITLLDQGLWACSQLDAGYTGNAVVRAYESTNPMTDAKASEFISTAVVDLCSWHLAEAPVPELGGVPRVFSLGPPQSSPNDVGPQSPPNVPQESPPDGPGILAHASYVTKRGGGHGHGRHSA